MRRSCWSRRCSAPSASTPESLEFARALADLADLYRTQARYDEAEPLFHRAIALLERPATARAAGLARALNSLALVYRAQGCTSAPSRSVAAPWRSRERSRRASTPAPPPRSATC